MTTLIPFPPTSRRRSRKVIKVIKVIKEFASASVSVLATRLAAGPARSHSRTGRPLRVAFANGDRGEQGAADVSNANSKEGKQLWAWTCTVWRGATRASATGLGATC